MTVIGRWDFTSDNATKNLVSGGHFGDLELRGNSTPASLGRNSGLTVNQDCWARIPGAGAKVLTNKTLIAWVLPSKVGDAMTGGAALSLFTQGDNRFDALVFAERQPRTWMAGSDYFKRSDTAPVPAAVQDDFVNIQKLAVTHENVGANQVEVKLHVNDVLVHSKIYAVRQAYTLARSELLLGPRHIMNGAPVGSLLARILAVEVHDAALDPAQLAAIARPGDAPGSAIIGITIPDGFTGDVDLRLQSPQAFWKQRTTIACDAIGYKREWQSHGTGKLEDYGQDTLSFPSTPTGQTHTIRYTIEHQVKAGDPWQPNAVRKVQTATTRPNGDIVWLLDSEDGGDKDYDDTRLQLTVKKDVPAVLAE